MPHKFPQTTRPQNHTGLCACPRSQAYGNVQYHWKMEVHASSKRIIYYARMHQVSGFRLQFSMEGTEKGGEKMEHLGGGRQEIEEGSVDSEEATGYRKCKYICRNAICRQIMTN